MITKLDPSINLPAFRDEWLKIGTATGPDDVDLRDRSIDLAYRAAGLEPPRLRIVLRSPLEGVIAAYLLAQVENQVRAQVWDQVGNQVWAQVWDQVRDQVGAQIGAQVGDQIGAQVRAQIGAQVRAQVWAQVRAQVWAQVRAQVWAQVGNQVWAQVRDQVRDQVWAQVWDQVRDQVGAQIGAQVWDQVRAQVWAQVGAQVWAQVGYASYGTHDASWLGFYSVFRLQFRAMTDPMEGLWGLSRSTGWFWPFAGAVIFTPRPSELHMVHGQLHRDGAPAILYPDGFALFRLNGISVPEWLAVKPAAEIQPREMLGISNAEVRREFVRKVGIVRICQGLNARVVSSCGLYELLELDIGDGRRRPYLKMQNPSVDAVHIEGVHPDCKTVQDALNYRNGLTADQIDDVNGAEFWQQGDVILKPRGATKFKSRPKILT